MPKEEGMGIYVMLEDWPQGHPDHVDQALATKWNHLLSLRSELTKALELARQEKTIGHPLDAAVTIYADGDAFTALEAMGNDRLAAFLIVSEVEVVEGRKNAPANAFLSDEAELAVVVAASTLEKCERCWIHRDSVGEDAEHPTVCARCASVLKEQ